MPKRSSLKSDVFLKTVARSGLISDERLQKAVASASDVTLHHADQLADYLTQQGLLSAFQASKLLQGVDRGLVLGPYHILAPVGRGGMSAVYLARDTRNQRLVALKVLPPQRYMQEERQLLRFRREMEICAKVSHPHLTRTFDSGVLNNVYYIAMEYVPGVTLRRKVADVGPLPVARCARLFAQVASALDHAHSQGLIHRDLKPANIMITPNGHAKVLDLGLALIEGEELPEDKTIVGGQGYVVGTMDFVAPEQVTDATGVDGRADLYSFGCSLFYALTGRPPFPGGTSQQKIRRHLNELPPSIADLNPTVPAGFVKLIEQLMSKRPEDRPARAEDVRRFLMYWAGDEPELPMDMAVDNADPHEVFDLQSDQIEAGSFWETVPVSVFVKNETKPAWDRPEKKSRVWLYGILALSFLAGFFLVGFIIAIVVLLKR
jgi:serine/threonine protein kinase